MSDITPEFLLEAYQTGYFPMARSCHDPQLYWLHPLKRGILPLEGFHVPRSLGKLLKKCPFELRVDTAFADVIHACATVAHGKSEDSWINPEIMALYRALFEQGHAHSVECWEGKELVGGLYGVSIGGAFFGESMFSRAANASKVALVHLVERLRAAGYKLLDTQFVNEHLKQFGVQEIPRADYMARLANALQASPNPSSRFLTASPARS